MDRSIAARRVAPVAVFAAVLGGIVLVSDRSTTGTKGGPRPLPISAASGARDSAMGAGAPMRGAAAPEYWSEIRIPDRLLQGIPTEGPASKLVADESRIDALARALGVEGERRKRDGTWVVGSGDRVLSVMPYPGQPWYLGAEKTVREPDAGGGSAEPGTARPVTEPVAPPTAKPQEPNSSSGSTPVDKPAPDARCPSPKAGEETVCAEPVPMPQPTMPPQPSDETARAAMDRVLAAVDLRDAAVTTTPGYMGKEVTAAPVVGGLPTVGYETRVTVDANGRIAYASGMLARARSEATYPLLDPRKAVERGTAGYARDMPAGQPALGAPAIATASPDAGREGGTDGATGSPTPDPQPSPMVREAKTLRLGLMFMPSYEPDGDAFLVPAWLLGFEESTWEEPFMALPDEYVDKPPAPSGDPDGPVCDPSPCPTKDAPPPPDGSTSSGSSGSGGGSSGYDPGATAVDPSPSAT